MAMHNSLWKQTYRLHVLGLETFQSRLARPVFNGEQTVYLAGMIARELDGEYRRQCEAFYLDDATELESAIRRHGAYIGQNAPVALLARINAERWTAELAAASADSDGIIQFLMPARFFGVAAYFSHLSGKNLHAAIFDDLRNRYTRLVELLRGYLQFLTEEGVDPAAPPCRELLQRFGGERNERNRRKETLEAMGLHTNHRNRLAPFEFRRMLDYGQPN